MAVLTWQNVDAPRSSYGAPSIGGALEAMNNGFNALQSIGKQYRDDANATFDNAKAQNTGALINALANIQSTTDLQKQISSGAFSADNLAQRFGGAVDYTAVNKALTDRLGQIQTDQNNQLALNENTDYQAHQADIAKLASLANTDPAAYNKAVANTDLGLAAGKILAQVNPYMDQTRQDATTQRGQSLNYAANMAQIAQQDKRLQFEKDKYDASITDDQYALGQKFGTANAGKMSATDAQKALTTSPQFLALTPDGQKAALQGLSSGLAIGSQLTDAEQKTFNDNTQATKNLIGGMDARAKTLSDNFAATNPNFLSLQGAQNFAGKTVADSVADIKKVTNYNDNGELADLTTQLSRKYNLPPAVVASVAQNNITSSAARFGGLWRDGMKLDKDGLERDVAAYSDYTKSGKAYDDQQKLAAYTTPITQFKQQASQLQAQLQRQLAAGDKAGAAETNRNLQTLTQAGLGVYNTLQQQGAQVASSAANAVPENAAPSMIQGLTDTFRNLQR